MINITNQHVIFIIISFLLSALLSKPVISILYKIRLKLNKGEVSQEKRKKILEYPTIGGVIIFVTVLLFFIFFIIFGYDIKYIWLAAFSFAMGIIGIVDDYLTIHPYKEKRGINPVLKIIIQIITTKCFLFYLAYKLHLNIDFFGFEISGFLYSFLLTFVFAIFINYTNLSDDIDGLFAGTVSIITLGLGFAFNSVIFLVLGGACLGYLITSSNLSKSFMGNTGSLFIGSILVGYALLNNMLWIMFIAAAWYIVIGITQFIQWVYKKITKKIFGEERKIFKKTPLHYHLLDCGFSEYKLTINACIITFIFVLFALSVAGVFS